MFSKSGLANEFSATPRGQLNWTGPIANGSESSFFFLKRRFGGLKCRSSEKEEKKDEKRKKNKTMENILKEKDLNS